MTTTVTTTIIEDETTVITVRMGASMVLTARQGDDGENVYTLPGQAEQTDTIDPLGPYTYGPYPFEQTFSITATGIVQADVAFTNADSGGVVFNYVAALPSTGQTGVIYCTETAAYWWSGAAFIPMGSGASGSFTTLAVSGVASFADGTEALPSITNTGDPNTGVYFPAADTVGVSAGAVTALTVGAAEGSESLRVVPVASAVNRAQVLGATTGNGPTLNATGTDAAVGINYSTKGAGAHAFFTNDSTELQLAVTRTEAAVNFPSVTGSVAGQPVPLAAAGADTNIDLILTPKGTGNVRFGTAVASVATPSTDMIQIKTADGTTFGLLAVLIP